MSKKQKIYTAEFKAEAIKAIESGINNFKSSPSIPPAMLESMLAPMQEQLKALLMDTYDLPKWLCIYPHKPASMKEKLNPFNLVHNKYNAQCMCEWTHRLSSKVMKFTQPKAWVRISYLFIFHIYFYLVLKFSYLIYFRYM
jgi:hypothetical protein